MKQLLKNGVVTPAMIDTKVRRLLTWIATHGGFEKHVPDASIPADNPKSASVALDVARDGLTLLKNDAALLPIDRTKVRNIVVMGPNAKNTPIIGGGSGYVDSFHSVSIFAGLTAALGADHVTYVDCDPLGQMVDHTAVDGGVYEAEYFENTTLSGAPALKRTESHIGFSKPAKENRETIPGLRAGPFSARFRAKITPQATAVYTFFARADDGMRVTVDGTAVIDDWRALEARTATADLTLEAGKTHDIVIEYFDAGGAALLRFGAGHVETATFTEADAKALRDADAVVACVGFTWQTEEEGYDRSYVMPAKQDEIVLGAAAMNPKTIVILNGGGSMDMGRWVDHVPALLHAYYAGQEGGRAIAEVLLGDVNPSGRLPFAIEAKLSDLPSAGHWGEPGPNEYAEGVFSGYRGFDQAGIAPRFPFGFGLGYSPFAIENAAARVDGDEVIVTADVVNTGDRSGASVVQCYVEPPAATVPRPVRELRAFTKKTLAAKARTSIELRIPRQDLAYWDMTTHGWIVTPGKYVIRLGFNSRDLPASVSCNVP